MLRTALFTVAPLVFGFVSAGVAGTTRTEWYASLKKPQWQPPSWVFGPVWTVLYLLTGYASSRIRDTVALTFFFAQIVVNCTWSPVFFRARRPFVALVVLHALLVLEGVTIALFSREDVVAGVIFVPYVCWSLFAAALNASIVESNGEE